MNTHLHLTTHLHLSLHVLSAGDLLLLLSVLRHVQLAGGAVLPATAGAGLLLQCQE